MLAGQRPFRGEYEAAIMYSIINEEPQPFISTGSRRSDVPLFLENIIKKALAKNPEERYRSADDLLVDFRSVEGKHETGVPDAGWSAPAQKEKKSRLSLFQDLHQPRARSTHIAGLIVIVLIVISTLFIVTRQPSESDLPASTSPTNFRTLAVLPFVNVGGDTTDVYFADGMADELTTALVRVPGLRVAARSSAFRFRGGTVPAREVARALAVEAILEGTVRRSGERLRVTAQLTNAADGLVLWADRFERRQQDVFDVQDEITHAIVTASRGTLAGESATGAPRGTADLEAYDLYLKGRFFWAKRGEIGLRRAIDFFNRAIARDPDFARAHAGLAMSYVVLPIFTVSIPADSAIALAQRSAARALALDSTLADAHLAMANALKMKWRWPESERHFRNALALAPDDAPAHHWYGVYLYALGRPDESARELQRARELDPFGSTIATDGAIALYAARRFGEARAEIQRAYSLDSTKSDTHLILGLIQLAMGHADSALRSFEHARRRGTGLDVRPYLSVSYRALGRHREADAIYAELLHDYDDSRALAYDVAIAAIGAGDLPAALAAVERIMEERHMFVTELSLPCDPLFDPVKSEPRFGQLLSRAGMQMSPAAPLPPYLDTHNQAR
jgi:serine/threonine-protein kinase